MAKKTKRDIVYFCNECGYESGKWLGQCPTCGSWNSFVEQKIEHIEYLDKNNIDELKEPLSLKDIESDNTYRLKTGISEFDHLIGGGIVKGSLTLLGGAPGIGKSTLVLQISKALSDKGYSVLYVSGEENLSQIKLRADRIGEFNQKIKFLDETELNKIIPYAIKTKPDLLIIDSIQTMTESGGIAGSITEIKNSAQILFRLAKDNHISVIMIGHITKDGNVAGPKILEHIVDTVLYFEDDQIKQYNLLRCYKNRFGSNKELAVFEMTDKGLKEVVNPSMIFLDEKSGDNSGCAITCCIDSNKPIFLEVQALVTKSSFSMPRRTINGSDFNRLNILIAIIEKRMNISLFEYDVYVNITGGLKIKDTSIDLAIIMAILSSYKNKNLPSDAVYCGEVGLSGELRNIPNVDIRIKEASRLGYKKIYLPNLSVRNLDKDLFNNNIEIVGKDNVVS